jgi:ABC-type cobalamin transport system permease subunit
MTRFDSTRHWRQIFLSLAFIGMIIHLGCSEQSEQLEVQENPAKELRARLVFYAIPG